MDKFSENHDASNIRVIDLSKMSLFEVIQDIKARPDIWLPEYTINCLDAFLLGWAAGKCDWDLLCSFSDFVGLQYAESGAKGWARILTDNEGEYALEKSMQLFAEYEESNFAKNT